MLVAGECKGLLHIMAIITFWEEEREVNLVDFLHSAALVYILFKGWQILVSILSSNIILINAQSQLDHPAQHRYMFVIAMSTQARPCQKIPYVH